MYYGIVETESLHDTSLLKRLVILKTRKITPVISNEHSEWVTNVIQTSDEDLLDTIKSISKELKEDWYAALFNDQNLYIIFKDKTFKLRTTQMSKSETYDKTQTYALDHGIQKEYVDFEKNLADYRDFLKA